MYRLFFLLFVSVLCHLGYAQDISGKWHGNYGKVIMGSNTKSLEVNIELYDDSLVRGTTLLGYGNDKYENYVVKGVYHRSDSSIYIKEVEEISVKLGLLATNVMGNYTMKLKMNDTLMRLDGEWVENGSRIFNMHSKVWLEKNIPKKATLPVAVAAKDKNLGRQTRLQQTIELDNAEKDSIKIEILDNVRIDNDEVSVYINDSLVLHQERISRKALVLYTSVSSSRSQCVIKLAAESYGSMPPCTAQIIITTRKNSYAFDLASKYSTNAAIELVLKDNP